MTHLDHQLSKFLFSKIVKPIKILHSALITTATIGDGSKTGVNIRNRKKYKLSGSHFHLASPPSFGI